MTTQIVKLENILQDKISLTEIRTITEEISGNREFLSKLWRSVSSDDRRTGVNALWVMSHLPDADSEWLVSLRDEMIDILLKESDVAKKRMLLQILRDQDYEADNIRSDFLDYCLSKINSECEPYAVRCFSLYAAFKMCKNFPELIAELELHLELLRMQHLSPGLQSALRQTEKQIRKVNSR